MIGDQGIRGLLKSSGRWVVVARWDCEGAEYDAAGWLEKMSYATPPAVIYMPGGSVVYTDQFAAFSEANDII
ncbi:hypothetical protein [Lentilitoribacter sp. Alg239-R112]|uniref:hypothetical protein n=1 Tax=Lentilitoribacter sp. Alg239-R112 TaxID=2305987 RepID=UPI0013A6E652|nr:hypothetical protein [Lentilitoribacter sp. Alg239-R112]